MDSGWFHLESGWSPVGGESGETMSLIGTVNINLVLDKLKIELSKLADNEQFMMETISKIEDQDVRVVVAEYIYSVTEFEQYWSKYCNMFDLAVEKDVESLTAEIERLKIENNILKSHVQHLNTEREVVQQQIEHLADVVKCIDNNANLIAGSIGNRRKMSQRATGEHSVKFDHSVDNEQLVKDYCTEGFKITQELLDKYPSMTYDGLRKRLMSLGAWRGRK